jgi:hypothetical protein
MKLKGTDNPHSIFKNSSFKQSLKRMGYAQTIEGFEKCLKKEIKTYSLSKLSKELNISDWALRTWMDKFNIKNPRGRGGPNNPWGRKCKPKKGS